MLICLLGVLHFFCLLPIPRLIRPFIRPTEKADEIAKLLAEQDAKDKAEAEKKAKVRLLVLCHRFPFPTPPRFVSSECHTHFLLPPFLGGSNAIW